MRNLLTAMRRLAAHPWMGLGLRWLIGAVLLGSALGKIRQPYDFLSAVYGYEILGPKAGMLLAMALPWIELCLSACLLGGIMLEGAIFGSLVLFFVFVVAIGSVLFRGLAIDCGCFGATSQEAVTHTTLLRALGLALLTVWAGHVHWKS